MTAYGDNTLLFMGSVAEQDAGLYLADGSDLRTYPGHDAITEIHKDINDLPARTTTGSGAGRTYRFETVKDCDRWERLWLVITLANLNVVGGTYKRLCDGFALAAVDRIEFRTANQLVHTIYPSKSTFQRFDKSLTYEERQKCYPQVGLGFSAAERSARANGTQVFYMPIDTFWHDDPTKDLIVPGLSSPLLIDVYFRPDSDLVQTDGTAPAAPATMLTYTDVQIRFENIHTDQMMRQNKVSEVMGGNKLTMMYKEVVQIPNIVVLAGTTLLENINIEGLNGPIQELTIAVRRRADTTVANQKDWFNFPYNLQPDLFGIKANQNDVVRRQRVKDFLKPVTESSRYSGALSQVFTLVWAEAPEAALMATGHWNLQYLTNPRLTLGWDTALPEDVEIEIFAVTRNWIEHTGGTLRRIFNP